MSEKQRRRYLTTHLAEGVVPTILGPGTGFVETWTWGSAVVDGFRVIQVHCIYLALY